MIMLCTMDLRERLLTFNDMGLILAYKLNVNER